MIKQMCLIPPGKKNTSQHYRSLLTTMSMKFRLQYGQLGLILNPLTAKLFNLNFHPLEVVSR